MTKTLCKLAKRGKLNERDEGADLSQNARLVCRKCGRMANKKKRLCKPVTSDGSAEKE
jgi:hypothetical protein